MIIPIPTPKMVATLLLDSFDSASTAFSHATDQYCARVCDPTVPQRIVRHWGEICDILQQKVQNDINETQKLIHQMKRCNPY